MHRPPKSTVRIRPRFDSLESRQLLSVSRESSPYPISDPGGQSASIAAYDAQIGATATRLLYQVDGSGLAAAVIDTGVNYRNPALGGSLGGPGSKVSGIDLAQNDNDPDASWQHGTHIAGIIAGEDSSRPGVAPGADIVAIRVFDDNGNGSFDTIANALQWVLDNHEQYHISVVNLSVSDGGNYTTDRDWLLFGIGRRLSGLIDALAAEGIPVVGGSGNSFDGSNQGMGFTAILHNTLSVTGTTDQDALISNAQRLGQALGGASATDLAAPGENIPAPSEGSSYTNVSGTSFSTAIVSGAVVVLQSLYKSRFGSLPTLAQLEGWLRDGARTFTDSVTGITVRRLDLAASAALVPRPQAPEPEPEPDPPTNPLPPADPEPPSNPTPPTNHEPPSTPAPPATPPNPTDPPVTPPIEPPLSINPPLGLTQNISALGVVDDFDSSEIWPTSRPRGPASRPTRTFSLVNKPRLVRIEQRREELTAVRARQKAVRLAERILRRAEFLDDRALHDRE